MTNTIPRAFTPPTTRVGPHVPNPERTVAHAVHTLSPGWKGQLPSGAFCMKNTSAMTRRELITYVTGLKAMIAQLQAEIRRLTQ